MSRRADPERLYVAHRMALAGRLVSQARITAESAERWIGAWEAEARSRGLDARTPEWWRPAWEWIAAKRVGHPAEPHIKGGGPVLRGRGARPDGNPGSG